MSRIRTNFLPTWPMPDEVVDADAGAERRRRLDVVGREIDHLAHRVGQDAHHVRSPSIDLDDDDAGPTW